MIYLLIYLFIEIVVSYEFTAIFTPFGMFLEVVLSLILGIVILKNMGFSLVENMMRVAKREISQEEFISIGLFKLVGAILLILPGVFSDIIGLLMQFDEFGAFVGRTFLPKRDNSFGKDNKQDDDIIDVEIVEDKR